MSVWISVYITDFTASLNFSVHIRTYTVYENRLKNSLKWSDDRTLIDDYQ
jgi:hypothetical protein